MKKILISTLALLTAQQVMGSLPVKHLSQQDDLVPLPDDGTTDVGDTNANEAEHKPPTYDNPVDDHFDEDYSFKFKKVTSYTKEEITTFWKNKTDGEKCTALFIEIYEKFQSLDKTVIEIKAKIDKYNKECSDKCMPGYVKCEGDNEDRCIDEDDCCKKHYKVTCDTQNHPWDFHNYATGYGEVLRCYDWCCKNTEVYCEKKCLPYDGLGWGYGHDDDNDYKDEYGKPQHSSYPHLCCKQQDCCDKGTTFIDYLTQKEPFCCKLDDVLQDKPGQEYDQCCCKDKDAQCCPNLKKNHCQPKENYLCCDPDTQIYCKGQCWPKDKPCCTGDQQNCPYQNDKCLSYCCCDGSQECCEKRKQCMKKGEVCCGYDEQECYGGCIPKGDHCCPHGQKWCEYKNCCIPEYQDCCKTGFDWCTWTKVCEPTGHCCDHKDDTWCEGQGRCVTPDEKCCPSGKKYCKWTDSCIPEYQDCCEYSNNKHYKWCELKKQCADECDCCPAGKEACKCVSGTHGCDTTCYDKNGKECCTQYWCAAAYKCVKDEKACCEATGHSYVGPAQEYYQDKYCCDKGDNAYSYGVPGENDIRGCCNSYGPHSDCCRAPKSDEKSVTFQPDGTCKVEKKPPCPCEGCCDFNCCDELDYFMHRAYEDNYKQGHGYKSFFEFYSEWYDDFYDWWNGKDYTGHGTGDAPVY